MQLIFLQPASAHLVKGRTVFIISKALGMTITVIVTALALLLWQFSLADLNVIYKRSQDH